MTDLGLLALGIWIWTGFVFHAPHSSLDRRLGAMAVAIPMYLLIIIRATPLLGG